MFIGAVVGIIISVMVSNRPTPTEKSNGAERKVNALAKEFGWTVEDYSALGETQVYKWLTGENGKKNPLTKEDSEKMYEGLLLLGDRIDLLEKYLKVELADEEKVYKKIKKI